MIKSKSMRWARNVARVGEVGHLYKILVGKSEGKRPQGRRKYRWEDNIKVDLRETGKEGID
jgi:hypothetical protein